MSIRFDEDPFASSSQIVTLLHPEKFDSVTKIPNESERIEHSRSGSDHLFQTNILCERCMYSREHFRIAFLHCFMHICIYEGPSGDQRGRQKRPLMARSAPVLPSLYLYVEILIKSDLFERVKCKKVFIMKCFLHVLLDF